MSVENVKKFYEAVSQDESLKQKFVELSQKYQGQQMDEAKANILMEQEVLPIAARMGYSFTMNDLKSYSEEMIPAKMNCELSDEEMQAVTGGNGGGNYNGFCIIFGVANFSWACTKNGSVGSYDTFLTGFCVGTGTVI